MYWDTLGPLRAILVVVFLVRVVFRIFRCKEIELQSYERVTIVGRKWLGEDVGLCSGGCESTASFDMRFDVRTTLMEDCGKVDIWRGNLAGYGEEVVCL